MASIDLGSDLGIERASDLKDLLAAKLGSVQTLELGGARVERIHSASLQLLCAFVRERDKAGHKTRIADPSPALVDAARVLALTTALGLPESGDE